MLPYRMRFAPQVTWKSWKKCAPEDRRHLSRSRSAATSHECHLLSRHTVYLSNTLYIARTKIFQVLIHSKLEMMENSGSADLSVRLCPSVGWSRAAHVARTFLFFQRARRSESPQTASFQLSPLSLVVARLVVQLDGSLVWHWHVQHRRWLDSSILIVIVVLDFLSGF